MRPAVRYHGGKWMLAPWIISTFPTHRVYVEPFGGGASVLLRKPRTYSEVYNDLDGEMVNLFRVLREEDTANRLRQMLELTPFARDEFKEAYLPSSGDPVEDARRTMVKSFMGFGSAAITANAAKDNVPPTGFRVCSNRSGTTPAHDWANYPANLPTLTDRLRGVVIENRPAVEVINQHDGKETLHYVDPPYVHSTRTVGNPHCRKGEYRYEMTDAEHEELIHALHKVAGMVVLSGYHSPLYDSLLKGWRQVEKAAHADGARPRREVLWFNEAAAGSLPTQLDLEVA